MKKVRSNAAMLHWHHLSNALESSCISVTFLARGGNGRPSSWVSEHFHAFTSVTNAAVSIL